MIWVRRRSNYLCSLFLLVVQIPLSSNSFACKKKSFEHEEMEGCGTVQHLRTKPKRMLGLGKIEPLNGTNNTSNSDAARSNNTADLGEPPIDWTESDDTSTEEVSTSDEEEEETKKDTSMTISSTPKKTWAMLVNPTLSQSTSAQVLPVDKVSLDPTASNYSRSDLENNYHHLGIKTEEEGGQFSDAEEDKSQTITTEKNDLPETLAPDDFPCLASLRTSISTVGVASEKEQPQKKKLFNSFSKYKGIITAKGSAARNEQLHQTKKEDEETSENNDDDNRAVVNTEADSFEISSEYAKTNTFRSRIIGCEGQSEDLQEVDNGEGWINEDNFSIVKASGHLIPSVHPSHPSSTTPGQSRETNRATGPPIARRCACATTDFAMQNIILQMGMKLLSIDGRTTIRRVKQWVTRCRACFHIYYNDNNNTSSSRLFCSKCGSDCLERIAASVDGTTGRIRLHYRKAKPTNLRGTKFSLPRPGRANKYEGDILLREDQLLVGAWHQKVIKGSKAVSSMFGSDISDTVGLGDLTKRDDIQVGFGRRNPNATKFGRERRGKKKKTTDKACGLRRY